MAPLPDPHDLDAEEQRAYDHVAEVRGEGAMLEVYHRLFNHPPFAIAMGALGEQLRFRGVLPDDVRELIVLLVARRMGVAYEWAHHVDVARAAGVADEVIDAIERGELGAALDRVPSSHRAALIAADHVYELESIPPDVQQSVAEVFGVRGVIEVAAVVGAYRMMGGMILAFDVELEPGFARPRW